MLGSTYSPPAIPAGAQVELLRKQDAKANKLTPDTPVHVINRGTAPVVAKFDGEDYEIPPFTHKGGTYGAPFIVQMPYGAATLFQRHAVIPGSRDAYSTNFSSFLGILGVDSPEACEPLSEEDLRQAGQSLEAIARDAGEVRIESVKDAVKRGVAQAGIGNAPRAPQSTLSTLAGETLDKATVMSSDGISPEILAEAAEGEAELAKNEPVGARKGRR